MTENDKASPTEIYTPETLAKYLHISSRTTWQLLKDGKIKHFRVGRQIRITASDVADFMAASRKAA